MINKKVLVICIILIIVCLVATIKLRKTDKIEQVNVELTNELDKQNIDENEKTINNEVEDTNISEKENTVKEIANENNVTKEIIEQSKTNMTDEFKGEEETKNNEKEKEEDYTEKALELVKKEWGEDETVYYTVDNQSNSIFNISVRSKDTTATLAEYEVNIDTEIVTMK